jgi:hypothetical protein
MGGIYEVPLWDGLRCHDIHTEFHKYWFRHSNVNRGRYTHTDSMGLASFSNTFRKLDLLPSSDDRERNLFLSKVRWKELVSIARPLDPCLTPDDGNRSSFRNIFAKVQANEQCPK